MDTAYFLNRPLDIYRRVETPDGMGGTVTGPPQLVGSAMFKVDQPSAAELIEAEQAQSSHSHNIYALPATDIQRGDELREAGKSYRLIAVVQPSEAVYAKALAELVQREP